MEMDLQTKNTNMDFKKGDYVKYDNGQVQEVFTVYKVGEYHLYSTPYNIPSYNKKYCKKI